MPILKSYWRAAKNCFKGLSLHIPDLESMKYNNCDEMRFVLKYELPFLQIWFCLSTSLVFGFFLNVSYVFSLQSFCHIVGSRFQYRYAENANEVCIQKRYILLLKARMCSHCEVTKFAYTLNLEHTNSYHHLFTYSCNHQLVDVSAMQEGNLVEITFFAVRCGSAQQTTGEGPFSPSTNG